MRTGEDELDGWLERPLPGTPLAALVQERLAALPLDEAEVQRAADRAMRRLGARPRARWRAVAVSVGLAAAASLAFALWPRPPDRPPIEWTVRPAALGAMAAEVEAAADPEALAAALLEQGRGEEAAEIYRWLLALDPAGPSAARWQQGLVQALIAAEDREAAWTEALALRDRYGAGSGWAAHWGSAGDLVTDVLEEQALYWHGAGRKPVQPALLERAGVAYEMYLADLPAGPQDADVRYAYGELLYSSERFDEAWEQYHAVVERHPDSKRAQFCAESAVHAADKLAASHPGEQWLSLWEERLVESVDTLGELAIDDPRLALFEYKAAWLLGERGDHGRSREHFDRVIELSPDSREAQLAANLIVDSLVAEGAWGPLAARAQSWLEQGWADEELRARLELVLQEAARPEPVP
jgi:tetratricopeptide (TPR) repeat protein